MSKLTTRIALLRTTLASHPDHVARLEEQLHLMQVPDTLVAHATALQAATAAESATNESIASNGKAVFDSWKLLQKQLRATKNLLEWYLEKQAANLLPELAAVPGGSKADARAMALLDFATRHTESLTHPDVTQEVTTLREILTTYQAAKAVMPTVNTAESAADIELAKVEQAAKVYVGAVEAVLKQVFRSERAVLVEYGLVPVAAKKTVAVDNAPAAGTIQ